MLPTTEFKNSTYEECSPIRPTTPHNENQDKTEGNSIEKLLSRISFGIRIVDENNNVINRKSSA